MRGAPILAPGRCTGPWKHSGNVSLFAKAQGATPRTNCWLLYTDATGLADRSKWPVRRQAYAADAQEGKPENQIQADQGGFPRPRALGATLHRGKAMRKASKQH